MSTESLSQLQNTVRQTLVAAGAIVKKGFGQKRQITFKTSISPVTQIDLAAQKKIISIIKTKFPMHEFLAEESAPSGNLVNYGPPAKGYRWIIDPLDGTVNFIHGIPQASVSVAVEYRGTILAGGVMDPQRGEMFMAVKGRGAVLNGRKIHVSTEKRIIRSLLITGFPYDRDKNFERYLDILRPFLKMSAGIRRFGSAALDLSWIACGRAEGYWESGLCPWDMAAGSLLVEEAGGKISDFKGRRIDINHPKELLATNGLIHNKMKSRFKL